MLKRNSLKQRADILKKICEEYNAEPQEGRLLGGLSPNQRFDQFRNSEDQVIKLDALSRCFLAYEAFEETVRQSTITHRVGGVPYSYCDPALLRRCGQRQLLWFDPEDPDLALVTTLDREDPIVVERQNLSPANDQDSPVFHRELARVQAVKRHARTVFREISPTAHMGFRRNLVHRKDAELAVNIDTLRNQATRRRTERTDRFEKVRRKAKHRGIPVETLTAPLARVEESFDMWDEAIAAESKRQGKDHK